MSGRHKAGSEKWKAVMLVNKNIVLKPRCKINRNK